MALLRLMVIACISACAAACAVDEDCALNGQCLPSGVCLCNPGWTGAACGQLRLAPATATNGYNVPGTSSWGGAPVYDRQSSTYHMYLAEFVEHCGLQAWHLNSRIVHAVSQSPIGPYAFVEEVVPVYSHNPSVAVTANGTGLILMHIGGGLPDGPPLRCRNGSSQTNYSSPSAQPLPAGGAQAAASIGTLCSATLAGPWQDCGWSGAAAPHSFTNPTLWVLRNGSIAVGGNSNYSLGWTMGSNCSSFLCRAWSNATFKTPGRTGEDPWIFQDKNDYFHALFHDMQPDLPAGRHAYSRTGVDWTLTAELAYTGSVLFEDGSTVAFSKRERPHLLLDPDTRAPLALVTGVMQHAESVDDHCWTLAQAVLQS